MPRNKRRSFTRPHSNTRKSGTADERRCTPMVRDPPRPGPNADSTDDPPISYPDVSDTHSRGEESGLQFGKYVTVFTKSST